MQQKSEISNRTQTLNQVDLCQGKIKKDPPK